MKKSWFIGVFLALALVGLDQLSKAYVYELPYLGSGIAVFRDFCGVDFSIQHVGNRGAAWGMFADYSEILLIVRFALVLALLYYLIRKSHPSERLPLFLALGGASSNILDLFTYGYVVDFFHFRFGSSHFPLFNFADSAICVSVLLLLLRRPRKEHAARL